MTRIRLLPVVVFAALALLAFKTIGLITEGGYALSGVSQAVAAGPEPDGDATAHSAEPTANINIPSEPTASDTSPVLQDPAPILAPPGESGHGAVEGGHGEAPAEAEHAAEPTAGGHDAAPSAVGNAPAVAEHPDEPPEAHAAVDAATVAEACAPTPAADAHGDPAPAALLATDCPPPTDAVVMELDDMGNKIPLTGDDGASLTEQTLLSRLGERRTELDAREQELNMRSSLLEAAEKRLQERTDALTVLQNSIDAMVEEKKAMEEDQFKGLVSMYEAMKPADAAKIFDALDADILLRVARHINPRKMSPILAKMNTQVAMQLTARLASGEGQTTVNVPPSDLAQLPQIVGQ